MTHAESTRAGRLQFDVLEWLGGHDADCAISTTLGSLRIETDPGQPPLTEVEDIIARTVRQHINVPTLSMARWLLMNWWRLRWEPRRDPSRRRPEWLQAHSMAAIGGGYAWPAIEFSSDGEFIQIQHEAEAAADVSAIRYLRNVVLDVPASSFEQATDRFISDVQNRLSACRCDATDLTELVSELDEERSNPDVARSCKLQAMAGIDPGEASDEWLRAANGLSSQLGVFATDEVFAVLPELGGEFRAVDEAIDAIRKSPTAIDLTWVDHTKAAGAGTELPWQRGSRLATWLRLELNLAPGPIDNQTLGDLLGIRLPLDFRSRPGSRKLTGALNEQNGDRRTPVLVTSPRQDNQRFYLARLIGCSMALPTEQALLPVTSAATGLQKFERAFAQELLCPWRDLDTFTGEHGLDDDGIAEAADYFQVSPLVILTTLVHKQKLPRDRLCS